MDGAGLEEQLPPLPPIVFCADVAYLVKLIEVGGIVALRAGIVACLDDIALNPIELFVLLRFFEATKWNGV